MERTLNFLRASRRTYHCPKMMLGVSPSNKMHNQALMKMRDIVEPYGRVGTLRKDLADAGKSEEDGGSGNAARFWDWSEGEVKVYV